MEEIGILTLVLIIANGLLTYQGLKDANFFSKYSFKVEDIIVKKEYIRLISSGFLHANWMHFAFNMITLYLFSSSLESSIGIPAFILLYFVSLIGGNLFALYMHRNHPDYSAIGASGAVSGIVLASIGLFPGMELGLILIPIFFPAWMYGIAFVLYSIYGIRSQKDNIGHEAHLGGGIVGLIVAIIIRPSIIASNFLPIILILVPTLFFLFAIIFKPQLLLLIKSPKEEVKVYTLEDKYNEEKVSKQRELDALLDKIRKKGFAKLSQKEKDRLKELSQ